MMISPHTIIQSFFVFGNLGAFKIFMGKVLNNSSFFLKIPSISYIFISTNYHPLIRSSPFAHCLESCFCPQWSHEIQTIVFFEIPFYTHIAKCLVSSIVLQIEGKWPAPSKQESTCQDSFSSRRESLSISRKHVAVQRYTLRR